MCVRTLSVVKNHQLLLFRNVFHTQPVSWNCVHNRASKSALNPGFKFSNTQHRVIQLQRKTTLRKEFACHPEAKQTVDKIHVLGFLWECDSCLSGSLWMPETWLCEVSALWSDQVWRAFSCGSVRYLIVLVRDLPLRLSDLQGDECKPVCVCVCYEFHAEPFGIYHRRNVEFLYYFC